MNQDEIKTVVEKINAGEVGVLPTDTIYGIVASVRRPEAIERIYQETSRPPHKPFIVLVSDIKQLAELGVVPTSEQSLVMQELWPGPVSVILPASNRLPYIHRGQNSIAVRLPDLQWLRDLIEQTGPIVATSANRSGRPTPNNINDIKQALPGFDFYIEGFVHSSPSRLVKVGSEGELEWLERKS